MRSVTLLGATGSIGASTLDLIERAPEQYRVQAVTAHRSVDQLADVARRTRAQVAAIADPDCYADLKAALAGSGVEVMAGEAAIVEAAARPADWTMAAIVGAAGLLPTLAAVDRGGVVALANKECLVCAGPIFTERVRAKGATLLPVDSEHNAIFQVFDFDRPDRVERIILTASGGPFRTFTVAEMQAVTPAQAVAHPVWSMGAKISVDSATLMNKGLEAIEAAYLFDLPAERIEIVIHPQSVIHSMVGYVDGSVLAQLGTPDMRIPIAYTLAWPDRIATPAARLDLAALGRLTFESPDPVRFPALRLARAALEAGGLAPAILNAANEVAVASFLDGKIGFLEIARIVELCLDRVPGGAAESLQSVQAADAEARRVATAAVGAQ